MPLSRFHTLLPWTGAIAGAAWIGQASLSVRGGDTPGAASSSAIADQSVANTVALACHVVMGMALIFFATAVRNSIRAGEAPDETYSSVAYGGWLLAGAGVAQLTVWGNGTLAAAAAGDDAALHTLDYVGFFGWAGMTIGIATAFIAMGLAGIRHATLPRWFSAVTIALGVLCALGAAHIPPGGLVTYLLLPFWLFAASVILARRQQAASGSAPVGTDERRDTAAP